MQKRIGMDAIRYLGDVMWEETDGPIPSMQAWPWRLSSKVESYEVEESAVLDAGQAADLPNPHPGPFPEAA